MSQDSLLQLIDSHLILETPVLLNNIIPLAVLASDLKTITERFMVKSITHCKDRQNSLTPEHELLLIELADTHQTVPKTYLMVLERLGSKIQPPSSCFADHPGSTTVLDSINKTLKDFANAFDTFNPPSPTSSSSDPGYIPLTNNPPSPDSTDIPLLTLPPIIDGPDESISPSPIGSQYRLSLIDSASLDVTGSEHAASRISASKPYYAVDQFVGARNAEHYAKGMLNLRQIIPDSLSFFDLVILAETVHREAPLYSIMKKQSFWYSQAICDVVLKVYNCDHIGGEQSVSRDDMDVPSNTYLPGLEGRWRGFMISKVEEAVSSVLVSKFRISRQEQLDQVSFFFNEECKLLNLTCR